MLLLFFCVMYQFRMWVVMLFHNILSLVAISRFCPLDTQHRTAPPYIYSWQSGDPLSIPLSLDTTCECQIFLGILCFMCPRYFTSPFLIQIELFFFLLFSLKLLHCIRTPFLELSASTCRKTFLWPRDLSSCAGIMLIIR